MKYNAVLDVLLSDGSSFVGNPAELLNITFTATEGQNIFQDDDLIDATAYILFVDGVFFDKVDSADEDKEFEFDSTTGEVLIVNPQAAGVKLTLFYAAPGSTLTTQAEPVTLNEVKDWIKIDGDITADDDLITALITAARIQCEGFLNVSLISRTVTAVLNNSLGGVELPYGPMIALEYVKDEEGDEVAASDYEIKGVLWKFIKSPCSDYLEVKYTAGYTVAPSHFKTAIKQQVAFMYENRGDTPAGSQRLNNQSVPTELSPMVKETLRPYVRKF